MPDPTHGSNGSDPNSILFDYDPAGASSATAKQDGLAQKGIVGVRASERMAEADAKRVLAHREKFIAAAGQFGVPPALLAAIASRESRGGGALDKQGFGDRGNGFGLMQVDKRFHTLEGAPDPTSLGHIMQAAGILATFRKQVAKRHPDWNPERQLQGAVAAYNAGVGNVRTLDGMDKGTTGNDYSNDVWARARFLAGLMGGAVHAAADAAAGFTMLQRGQRGDAVRELQETLMRLNYLELTEAQKATGLGLFGPKTEAALKEFQKEKQLKADGVYTLETCLALRASAPTPPPLVDTGAGGDAAVNVPLPKAAPHSIAKRRAAKRKATKRKAAKRRSR